MEQLGHTVSSNSNISINFRSAENDLNISQKIEIKPEISYRNSITKEIIEQKIFSKNEMPYILLKTNLCDRPIKLSIDTGAAVSIIASDLVRNEMIEENYKLNLFDIADKEICTTTQGMVYCIFSMNNANLKTKLHIVDRKYAGPGDGYLGFDFLASYKVNIDLNKMNLTINLKKFMKLNHDQNDILNNEPKNGQLNEEIEENFLNILAQYYDFVPEVQNKLKKNHRNKMILKKFSKNKPVEYNFFNEFDQKECQKNKLFKINTCQEKCPTSSTKKQDTVENYYVKSNSNNSHNVSLSNCKIIDSETYQASLARGKIPQKKIANCGVSTLMKRNCSKKRNGITPQVYENYKNLDSNTISVNYFKDYG